MPVDEQALQLVSAIGDLAARIGPEVAAAVEAAIKSVRPELVPDDLPGSEADSLAKEADAEIAAKFPPKAP